MTYGFVIGCVFGIGIGGVLWARVAERYGIAQFNAGRIRGVRESRGILHPRHPIRDEQYVGS